MKIDYRIIRSLFAAFSAALLLQGCSSKELDNMEGGYGHIQFHLFKDASYVAPGTKAANELDFLADAAKLKVTLRTDNNDILTPTVTLEAAEGGRAEYGLASDKIKLLSGDYKLTAYQIFDALDSPVYTENLSEARSFTITSGCLVSKDLTVAVTERGHVKFTLVKNCPEVKGSGVDQYPFYMISSVDVKIKNKLTYEVSEIKNLKTIHEFVQDEREGYDDGYITAVCKSDSLVSLKGGDYEIVSFRTYFDRARKVYETCDNVSAEPFTVKDNEVTEASVPVTLNVTVPYMKDALALKKIWEALDGPNWKVKWNFDSDVDIWTAQSGVQILENGRVASLNFEDTGARGPMPAEIGELTELRALYLGTHSYKEGGSVTGPSRKACTYNPYESDMRQQLRDSFEETFVGKYDPYACVSEELKLPLYLSGKLSSSQSARTELKYPAPDEGTNYSNGITSLPAEINKLEKLQMLYIAYSPLTSLPDDMSGLKSLTDMEMFYLPDLTEFPKGIATLPKIQGLTFACNYRVTPESLYDGLAAINAGNAAKSIQGLYLPNQKLNTVPDMTACEGMTVFNIQNCGATKFEKAFGKKHSIVQLLCSGNNFSELPLDDQGYFIGIDENTESVNFAGNKFTVMPDFFDAKSIYTAGTIDFSDNQISSFGTFGGTYRGLNCNTLNLSHNPLGHFPEEFAKSNSSITYIILQGCGIETISEDALKSDKIRNMTTIDLSYNKLKSLPDNFNSNTFPYLSGLDLSYNRMSAFPYRAVNNQYLTVFIFRHQRDAEGKRCMRDWPTGIGAALSGLRALYLGSNDIRLVNDNLSFLIFNLDISDNPNISIDVSSICPYIASGYFNLIYSPDQDIRGCDDYLNLNK